MGFVITKCCVFFKIRNEFLNVVQPGFGIKGLTLLSVIHSENTEGCNLSFTGAYSPGWTLGLPFLGFLITHTDTR
jgi:hypothetical protein